MCARPPPVDDPKVTPTSFVRIKRKGSPPQRIGMRRDNHQNGSVTARIIWGRRLMKPSPAVPRRLWGAAAAVLLFGLSACSVFQSVPMGPAYVPASGFVDGVRGQVGSYCYRAGGHSTCGDSAAPGSGASYPVAATTSRFTSEIRWSSVSAELLSADGKRRKTLTVDKDGRLGEIQKDQGWAFLTIMVVFPQGDTSWVWSLEGPATGSPR